MNVHEVLQKYQPDTIIKKIAPYLTKERIDRIEWVLSNRLDFIHVAVEVCSKPHNGAALVRTAEALGILHIHFIASEEKVNLSRGLTQGAHHWIDIHHHDTLGSFLGTNSYKLYGASLKSDLTLDEISIDEPICLMFGNESVGLSSGAQKNCHQLFKIPMVGMSESLNISVAAGIAMHHVVNRIRKGTTKNARPSSDVLQKLRAKYYLNSVDSRMLNLFLAQ